MHSIIRQIETSENVAEQLPGERGGGEIKVNLVIR